MPEFLEVGVTFLLGIAEPLLLENITGHMIEYFVQPGPGLDEIGVLRDSRFEQFALALKRIFRFRLTAIDAPCLHVEVVSFDASRRHIVERANGVGLDLEMQGVGDFLGHLALRGKHIHELAVVVAGPEMNVISSINQLHRNAHVVVDTSHGALDDKSHPEFATDVPQRQLRVDIAQCGGARDHAQVLDA